MTKYFLFDNPVIAIPLIAITLGYILTTLAWWLLANSNFPDNKPLSLREVLKLQWQFIKRLKI